MTEKLAAVLGGGDWYDASVDLIVVPDDCDLDAARVRYREWYRDVYSKQPQFKPGEKNPGRVNYLTFAGWLVKHGGARNAVDGEDYIEVWDGP